MTQNTSWKPPRASQEPSKSFPRAVQAPSRDTQEPSRSAHVASKTVSERKVVWCPCLKWWCHWNVLSARSHRVPEPDGAGGLRHARPLYWPKRVSNIIFSFCLNEAFPLKVFIGTCLWTHELFFASFLLCEFDCGFVQAGRLVASSSGRDFYLNVFNACQRWNIQHHVSLAASHCNSFLLATLPLRKRSIL